MEIKFDNSTIEKLCSSYKKAISKLGKRNADKLFMRLSTLEAATTLAEVKNMPGKWACSLDGGMRLIFRPEGDYPPHQVVCVIIIETIDYH